MICFVYFKRRSVAFIFIPELQQKEDELRQRDAVIDQQRALLDQMSDAMEKQQAELQALMLRVAQLEAHKASSNE